MAHPPWLLPFSTGRATCAFTFFDQSGEEIKDALPVVERAAEEAPPPAAATKEEEGAPAAQAAATELGSTSTAEADPAARASASPRKKRTSAEEEADIILEQLRTEAARSLERVADTFKRWDVDGGGKISRAEFKKVAGRLFTESDPRALEAAFDIIDADRSGEIDVRELSKHLIEHRKSSMSSRPKTLVSFEVDDDNLLERERRRLADQAASEAAAAKAAADDAEAAREVAELVSELITELEEDEAAEAAARRPPRVSNITAYRIAAARRGIAAARSLSTRPPALPTATFHPGNLSFRSMGQHLVDHGLTTPDLYMVRPRQRSTPVAKLPMAHAADDACADGACCRWRRVLCALTRVVC